MVCKSTRSSALRRSVLTLTAGAAAIAAAFAGIQPGEPPQASALAADMGCDFSNDGLPDTVTGIPGKTVNGKKGAGAIMVRYQFAALEFPVMYESSGLTPATGNHYGTSLACGDFDGDGDTDLAVGAPGHHNDAGAVVILYSDGTSLGPTWAFTQDTEKGGYNVPGAREDGDFFGWDLAAGDFNNDAEDDLAIGAPGEDVTVNNKSYQDFGAVVVLNGSGQFGLTANGKLLDPTSIGSEWVKNKHHGYYGHSLASGDFNADGIEDLAVGMPGATVQDFHSKDTFTNVGLVHELRGQHHSGLHTRQYFWESLFWPNDDPKTGDRFGFDVAAGDIDNNGRDDIAIGAPGDWASLDLSPDCGDVCEATWNGAGRLFTVKHADNDSYSYNSYSQGDAGVPGEAESQDYFGFSVAIGQFDGKYGEDIAVGVPGENWAQGAISMFYSGGFREIIWQGDWDIAGVPDADDWFGFSMARTDEDHDGVDDLIVGSPLEDLEGKTDTGVTHTIIGVQNVGLGAADFFSQAEDDGYQDWGPEDTNHTWSPPLKLWFDDYSGEGYGFAVVG